MSKSLPIVALLLYFPLMVSAQLSDQLVAKYYFNDGLANDEIGTVHGLISGATTTTDRWGNPDMAFHFAQGQFINLGDSFDEILTRQDSSFSWSFWYRADDLNNVNTVPISKYGAAFCSENERSFFIRLNINYEVDLLYYMTKHIEKYRSVKGHMALKDTCWHHVAVNYDPTTDGNDGLDRVEMYLDNVKQITSYFVPPLGTLDHIKNSDAMVSFGTPLSSFGTPCFDTFKGKIDDVRFYKRALTEADVDSLYHELNPVAQDNWMYLPASFTMSDSIICEGTCVQLENTTLCKKQSTWTLPGADVPTSSIHNPTVCYSTPGQYPIHLLTDIGYAYDTITKYITVLAKPLLELGNDTTICSNVSLVLDPGIPNATYQWSTGSTDSIISVSATNAYFVTVTDEYCTQSDVILVSAVQTTDQGLGMDTVLCDINNYILEAPVGSGFAYTWFDDSHGFTVPITEPGTYWLDIFEHNGYCVTRDSITISTLDLSSFSLGNDTTICSTDSVLLSVDAPGVDIVWSDGIMATSMVVNTTGNYWFTAELPGCMLSDSIFVNVESAPNIDLGEDTNLPASDSLVLSIDCPNATYLWSDNGTADTMVIKDQGLYWLSVTKGACTVSDSIYIYPVGPPLTGFGLGNDTTICVNTLLELSPGVVADAYLWSDDSQNETLVVSDEGTYWVEIEVNGFTYRDTIIVTISNGPFVDLGDPQFLCADSTILNIGTNGLQYLWSTGDTTATTIIHNTSNVSVTVTEGNCSNSDGVLIVLNERPIVDLGNDTTICEGNTITLSLSIPEATYEWSTGEISNQIIVNTTGTYEVAAQRGACLVRDTIVVTVNPIPVFDLGLDTTICNNSPMELSIDLPNTDLLWSTGSNSSEIVITESGDFWLQASNGSCQYFDTISINVDNAPIVALGNDTTICAQQIITLSAGNDGTNYEWSTGSLNNEIVVGNSGLYEVMVQNGACTVFDNITITIDSLPIFELGADTTICNDSPIALSVDLPGADLLWSTGSTNSEIEIIESGEYALQANIGDCIFVDTVTVNVDNAPIVELGNDTIICAQETVTLFAGNNSGTNYEWSTGAINNEIAINTSGYYWVKATAGVCEVRDSIHLLIGMNPEFTLGNDTVICSNNTITIGSQVSGNYLWSDNSTASTMTIFTEGTYILTVENEGCSAIDSITITEMLLPELMAINDTFLCSGSTLLLDIEQPQGQWYEWQDGNTSPSYLIESDGIYTYEIGNQCGMVDQTIVVVTPEPLQVDLGEDRNICESDLLLLDAEQAAAESYLWQDGSTNSFIEVYESGLYEVHVSNECGIVSDAIEIVVETEELELSMDNYFALCSGSTVTLDATTEGALWYEWQDGITASTYEVSAAGRYRVTVSNNCATTTGIVEVGEKDCCNIYIPTVFSPNGDGVNDVLEVFSNCEFETFEFQVFDRFGGLLFKTTEHDQFWDGRVKGQMVASAVYAYVLRYRNGAEEKILSGDISVMK